MKQIYEIEYLDEEERELIEDIESAPVQPPIPNMAAEIARYRRYAAYPVTNWDILLRSTCNPGNPITNLKPLP